MILKVSLERKWYIRCPSKINATDAVILTSTNLQDVERATVIMNDAERCTTISMMKIKRLFFMLYVVGGTKILWSTYLSKIIWPIGENYKDFILYLINILRPDQDGPNSANDVFKCILENGNLPVRLGIFCFRSQSRIDDTSWWV